MDSKPISDRLPLHITVVTLSIHQYQKVGAGYQPATKIAERLAMKNVLRSAQASEPPKTTVLIIDDHPLMLAILPVVAQKALGDVQVRVATSIEDAIRTRTTDDCNFALVLLDLGLPGFSGVEALIHLRERCHDAKIAVVSVSDDRETIQAAFKAGAVGYIPKSLSCDVIVAALKIIDAGSKYVPDQLLSEGPRNDDELSDRQRQVLALILRGLSNQEIAARLKIAESTVKQHVGVIYEVLNAKTRAEAIVAATRRGYRGSP